MPVNATFYGDGVVVVDFHGTNLTCHVVAIEEQRVVPL